MNYDNDTYGSNYRAAMCRSMARPAMRPTFVAMSPTTRPVGTRIDRRSTGLIKRSRRFWYHLHDALGVMVYGLGMIFATAFVIWFYSDLVQFFRHVR